jgi:hypothetical protein
LKYIIISYIAAFEIVLTERLHFENLAMGSNQFSKVEEMCSAQYTTQVWINRGESGRHVLVSQQMAVD